MPDDPLPPKSQSMTIATEVDDYLELPYVSIETNPTDYWKIH